MKNCRIHVDCHIIYSHLKLIFIGLLNYAFQWLKNEDAPGILPDYLYSIWLVVSTPLKKLVNWDDYSQYMGE